MFWLKQRRLRVDILSIFVSLLLFTSIAIITYSYIANTNAVLKVADKLITNSNVLVIEKLQSYLRPPPFMKIAARMLNDGILDPNDMHELGRFAYSALQAYPQLNNVTLADNNGNMFIENRVADNAADRNVMPFFNMMHIPSNAKFIEETLTRSQNKALLSITYEDEKGLDIKKETNISTTYDPRSRPWFIGAKDLTDQYWIGIFKFYSNQKPGITVSFPIKINNQSRGVIAADPNFNALIHFLQDFEVSKNSQIFIVNNQQQIIASKSKGGLANNGDTLLRVDDLKDIKISTAYYHHIKTGENNFTFKTKGISYIAAFAPYAVSSNESWEVVTIAPLDNFIGAVKAIHYYTLGFSLIMLALGLCLVILFAHKISWPIARLAAETKNIQKLIFSKPITIKTKIHEIQLMQDALNSTKAALSSFAKYVPKSLVAQLMKSGIAAELGGEKKNITLLFTDIENFTEIAEQMPAEALMLHLSEYLNTLTRTIQHYQGNIDKYIGDAIMAFWGAPLKDNDHVTHACLATLACQKNVRRMNQIWLAAGKPILPTRFGLNTGTAIVGNMGSNDRLNYTALGDNVNIAARLEAVNKIYGTEIIASESVYKQCADKFLFRSLGSTQLPGKQQAVMIYELLATKKDLGEITATPQQIELCESSAAAYTAYINQEFSKAITIFKDILTKFPQDGMARIYLQRCEESLSQ